MDAVLRNKLRDAEGYFGTSESPRLRGHDPGALWRYLPAVLALFLLMITPYVLHAQETGEPAALAKTAELPDWHVKLWVNVIHEEIWYFGWYSTPLGDINNDGYDDFAISSLADTTFVFLGGDPFNHEPSYIVRGGSSGIASGDFNRDGRMDLVTAIDNRGDPGEYPPERRGAIRIYLQKDGPVPFTWEPDLLIEGEVNELVGKTINAFRGSLCVLDYNGDGWPDIVTKAADTRDSVKWKGILYLGGPMMDGEYDAEFKLYPLYGINDSFVLDVLAGDLNGDGYDDVMFNGRYHHFEPYPYHWQLWLGNPRGRADSPDRVIRGDNGWSPQKDLANIMDIDGDGFDDILDAGHESLHRPLGDALLFHGRAELPMIILPDDSIPNLNPDPLYDLSPQIASPVGDMNGDGSPDLVMAWNKALSPGSSGYYFYPGGSQFRTPLGYFGTIPEQDFVVPGVFPAGDVNGDGYDDILTLGKGYKNARSNCFQIWLGAPQLKTAVGAVSSPASFDLTISPNPIALERGVLTIRATGLEPGDCTILVTDMLGKILQRTNLKTTQTPLTHTLHLTGLVAGTYLVSLRQGTRSVERKLIIF